MGWTHMPDTEYNSRCQTSLPPFETLENRADQPKELDWVVLDFAIELSRVSSALWDGDGTSKGQVLGSIEIPKWEMMGRGKSRS